VLENGIQKNEPALKAFIGEGGGDCMEEGGLKSKNQHLTMT